MTKGILYTVDHSTTVSLRGDLNKNRRDGLVFSVTPSRRDSRKRPGSRTTEAIKKKIKFEGENLRFKIYYFPHLLELQ